SDRTPCRTACREERCHACSFRRLACAEFLGGSGGCERAISRLHHQQHVARAPRPRPRRAPPHLRPRHRLMLIRPGGAVVAVGMPPNRATTPLRVADLVWSEQRLLGSRMGSTRLPRDVPHLIDLYLDGRLKLDELITARYPLAGINEAIAAMESGSALR